MGLGFRDDDAYDADADDERVKIRHPSAQMDDTEKLTKQWPWQSKRTFSGSTSVLAVIP